VQSIPLVVNQYRILPNPFTGTGSLLVSDGVPNDNDGIINNGQINIFPVPFDTYRVNQTLAPTGFSSLINFTFVTVHRTDLNATALFNVFDKSEDPADLEVLGSDILDIADNRFDEIVASTQLTLVQNGVQTQIENTTNLPSPLFIGVNNQTGAEDEAALQPSLLYKNINLGPNDTPENIRAAFALAPYDAGNFTETTFVGVFSATEESPVYGQYLATVPFDQFNCGQQYIYSLDDTLIPTFGGLAGFKLTIDSNGVCPDVQEDYLTFEVVSSWHSRTCK